MKAMLVHVGIRATDLETSIRFWRDLLELSVVAEGAGYYDLTDGFHNFRIFQHQGEKRPPHLGGLSDYLHIGVRVADLHDALERFARAGVPIEADDVMIGKPYDPANPPQKSFKVSDPDGIVVDVTASDDQWPGGTLGIQP